MVIFLKKLTGSIKRKKISDDRQIIFLKRLSRLLSDGYALVTALEMMKWDKAMKVIVEELMYYLERGSPLDVAFSKLGFNESITAYLYFARTSDSLVENLNKATAMFENRLLYVKKFTQLIRYPIILLFIFILLLYFIKKSILPSFTQLFQTSGESSQTVLLSIKFIDFMSNGAMTLFVAVIILFFIWKRVKNKIAIDKMIRIISLIPMVNTYMRMQTSYLFATHLGLLLKTGMSLKDILAQMKAQTSLPIIAYYASLMSEHLRNGQQITGLLLELDLLEKNLSDIFQSNSNVEKLEKDLTVYAALLAENLQLKMMKLLSYIQPLFFIALASFIIFIYVTLMWPMFQLIKTI